MNPNFIDGAAVERILDMPTCIRLMRQALSALASGEANQMVRPVLPLTGRNVLGMMPAFDSGGGVAGVKVLSVFPDNWQRGIPSHQGVIILFETDGGAIKAIVDAESITGIRTAAASAAATDALARRDASRLAILGAGLQGEQHLRAISRVRELDSVTVWDLDPVRAANYAEAMGRETGLDISACSSAHEASRDADIICTVTPAVEPILFAADVKPGAHINAVGACTPNAREIGSDLMALGRLFVDWKPAAVKEAGDYLLAVADGTIGADHILGEVGSVMNGNLDGRTGESDVTIFEALGQATQDVIAANHVANGLKLQEGAA